MPRDRDDDSRDDRDYDDRPRRRREYDDPPRKQGGGAGMVLLIVGLAVGIPVLVCGGVGVWMYFQVKKGFEQLATTVQSEMAAVNFLKSLETGNVRAAYDSTTPKFKSTTTFEQFEQLVKANPVLTTSHTANQSGLPTPTGTAPNRTVTLSFAITPGQVNDWDEDDAPPGRPRGTTLKPPPTVPKTPATTPTAKGITCTLTLVEQADNTWKVDGFTVP